MGDTMPDPRPKKKLKKENNANDEDDSENAVSAADETLKKKIRCNLTDILPDSLLKNCLSFVGTDQYLFVGGVSKRFLDLYRLMVPSMTTLPTPDAWKTTSIQNAVSSSVSCAEMVMKLIYQKDGFYYNDTYALSGIRWFTFNVDNDSSSSQRYLLWEFFTVCAAFHGSIDVLRWTKNHPNSTFNEGNIYYWKDFVSQNHHYSPFIMAIRGGHLDVVKWLYSSIDCDLESSYKYCICKNAVEFNKMDILIWAHSVGFPLYEWFSSSSCCTIAARYNRLDVLKWLRRNGCPWKDTPETASFYGRLELLKWAFRNGISLDHGCCAYAALNGHLDLLKWLRSNNVPWNEDTCCSAADGGHLEVLKWARQNNCPWDSHTLSCAKRKGHMEIYNWALGKGCPIRGEFHRMPFAGLFRTL